MRLLIAVLRQSLRSRWRLGHGHPRRRRRTAVLLVGLCLIHAALLLRWLPAPGAPGGLLGLSTFAACTYLFARGAQGLMTLVDSTADRLLRALAPVPRSIYPAGTLLGVWVYASVEVLALLSAAVLAVALKAQPLAILGYLVMPTVGLPAAALGFTVAALSMRWFGQGFTRLIVNVLQYAAPAAILYVILVGVPSLNAVFGWWAGAGLASGFLTMVALVLGVVLLVLAAAATPDGVDVATGGGGAATSTICPGGFLALLRKELRMAVRDSSTRAGLLAVPLVMIPVTFGGFSHFPLGAAVALGVFGAGLVGATAGDVLTRGEAERWAVLHLSPTSLSRLALAKVAVALPLSTLMAVGGWLVLMGQGNVNAPTLIAVGAATGAFGTWLSVKGRFRSFLAPNTLLDGLANALGFAVIALASFGVFGHIALGPSVGAVFLVLSAPLAAGALLLSGLTR